MWMSILGRRRMQCGVLMLFVVISTQCVSPTLGMRTTLMSLRAPLSKILATRGGGGGAVATREWLESHQVTVAIPPAMVDSMAGTTAAANNEAIILAKKKITVKNVLLLTSGAILVVFAYKERSLWLPLLNKQKIQETTLQILHSLVPENKQDQWKALCLYSLGMACWEFLGLSTIPVETAAGMVFGWNAAYASVAGKLLGAGVAFYSGRTILFRFAQQKLMKNPVFQLLNSSSASDAATVDGGTKIPPLATAFLMKYSCFPEFIKNFGSSLLAVIQPWMFFLATFVHGGMFTLLWTWLGKDAALGLEHAGDTALPVNVGLRVALISAGFVGVVVTPLLMAWWIRELQRQSKRTDATVITKD